MNKNKILISLIEEKTSYKLNDIIKISKYKNDLFDYTKSFIVHLKNESFLKIDFKSGSSININKKLINKFIKYNNYIYGDENGTSIQIVCRRKYIDYNELLIKKIIKKIILNRISDKSIQNLELIYQKFKLTNNNETNFTKKYYELISKGKKEDLIYSLSSISDKNIFINDEKLVFFSSIQMIDINYYLGDIANFITEENLDINDINNISKLINVGEKELYEILYVNAFGKGDKLSKKKKIHMYSENKLILDKLEYQFNYYFNLLNTNLYKTLIEYLESGTNRYNGISIIKFYLEQFTMIPIEKKESIFLEFRIYKFEGLNISDLKVLTIHEVILISKFERFLYEIETLLGKDKSFILNKYFDSYIKGTNNCKGLITKKNNIRAFLLINKIFSSKIYAFFNNCKKNNYEILKINNDHYRNFTHFMEKHMHDINYFMSKNEFFKQLINYNLENFLKKETDLFKERNDKLELFKYLIGMKEAINEETKIYQLDNIENKIQSSSQKIKKGYMNIKDKSIDFIKDDYNKNYKKGKVRNIKEELLKLFIEIRNSTYIDTKLDLSRKIKDLTSELNTKNVKEFIKNKNIEKKLIPFLYNKLNISPLFHNIFIKREYKYFSFIISFGHDLLNKANHMDNLEKQLRSLNGIIHNDHNNITKLSDFIENGKIKNEYSHIPLIKKLVKDYDNIGLFSEFISKDDEINCIKTFLSFLLSYDTENKFIFLNLLYAYVINQIKIEDFFIFLSICIDDITISYEKMDFKNGQNEYMKKKN